MRGGRRGSAERRAEIGLANSRAGDERGHKLAPVIDELRAAGSRSLREIAEGLTERRIPTPRGRRAWHAVQVRRVLSQIRWHRSHLEWQEQLRARGE
jgi:hypothetical protein